MNEITKIHLGRQPFVMAVDAYKLMQDYLHEIKHQVGKNSGSVLEEVEVRMAELLAERGVTGDKVVLAEDVIHLKEQLGSPSDFKDDGAETDEPSKPDDQSDPSKRLFRDTEHGMLAGVSSGLAAYFGIDAVIIRLLFIIATVTGGWGVPVYIILWLIVPEAKTASERLQMRGKAVTVDSLKEVVDRADVTGAAQRASRNVGPFIEMLAKIVLIIVGCIFVAVAMMMLVGIAMLGVNALLHNGHLLYGALQFPLGTTETVAMVGGFGVLAASAAFLLATGIAMVRRKWTTPGWATAALAAALLISLVAGGAAAPDTVQDVHSRYEASSHVENRTLPAFAAVRIEDGGTHINVRYEAAEYTQSEAAAADKKDYKVELRYIGDIDTKNLKTTVQNDVLIIDAREFKPTGNWDCAGLCIGEKDYFKVIVHAPQLVKDEVRP
jgi:phage shock protein PspC (stress-responsive transcriptional regulator)